MKRTVDDLGDLAGKRVLVRVDYNVPLNEDRQITDDTRIRETLPTLQVLLGKGARLILVAHLGRPDGQVVEKLRLDPIAKRLSELLPGVSVQKLNEVVSPAVTKAVQMMPERSIILLENVRFEPGEEKNDPGFAKQLAALADIYVDDAFGTAHRAHASTEGVAHDLPERVAGLLMAKELSALSHILDHPAHPFTAIIGGSKISTKIGVLEHLLGKVDTIVIGGAMMFTFLKARGLSVGSSKAEESEVATAMALLQKTQQSGTKLLLPTDVVIADRFANDANHQVVSLDAMPENWMGLDIGPETVKQIQSVLQASKTVLWNGPLGVFEFPQFAYGTEAIAKSLAQLTEAGQLVSVLGGGDTVAAIEQFQIDPKAYTHVSTGGGASLEFLEGKALPGVEILQDKAPASVA